MDKLKQHYSGAKSKRYFVIFLNKSIVFSKKGGAKDFKKNLKKQGIKAKLKVKLINVDKWNLEGKLKCNTKVKPRKIIHNI